MKVKQHDGSSTGGPEQPISKPLDKHPHQYLANETVPRDDFHEEGLDESLMENPGDLSKRFHPGRLPHKGRP